TAPGFNPYNQIPQLAVNGNGQVYIVPDLAYINIGVHSEADDVQTALSENNTQAQAIRQTLTSMGVADEDIQTTAFNVYPTQQYDPMGQPLGLKYVVDNSVLVTVRDLSNLGSLLDSAVQSGANTINSITFDANDKAAAYTQARKIA
ncbi:MAG: SIMPL domain-containing protein, partial [Anaerolineaceae bacterium]